MKANFYVEYDEMAKTWIVMQEDGGYEHGAYYDTMVAEVDTKERAEGFAQYLNEHGGDA